MTELQSTLLQAVWLAAIFYRRKHPPPRGPFADIYNETTRHRWTESNWIIDIYNELGCPPYPMTAAWCV